MNPQPRIVRATSTQNEAPIKQIAMSQERLKELLVSENMFGDTNYGQFEGPVMVSHDADTVGTVAFERNGDFQYALMDRGVYYSGRAHYDWENNVIHCE